MKIAIYTITKNEEKNVSSYMENVKNADGIFILDTGSTDKTVELLIEKGAIVHKQIYSNFRFDTAFNDSISFIPDDYDVLISLDLDERLVDGWRNIIEKELQEKEKKNYICYFPYVNSWKDKEQTIPAIIYNRNKIHSKKGVKWVYPVFCQTEPTDENTKDYIINTTLIHHYQSDREDRNTIYEDIIIQAIKDEPEEYNYNFSYAEMLMGNQEYDKAIEQWKLFLLKSDFLSKEYNGLAQRRSLAWKNIALCSNRIKQDPIFELTLLLRAVAECPFYREIWMYVAQIWSFLGNKEQSLTCFNTGLNIKNKELSLINEEVFWNEEELNKFKQRIL